MGSRRRWLPIVVGLGAAWLVAAVVLAGSGGDDAGEAAPGDTTAEDPTPSTRRPTTSTTSGASTTTGTIPGAPLLGRPTGLRVLVGAGNSIVDLDTGVITEPDEPGEVVAARADGVISIRAGELVWRPVPFSSSTVVALGDGDLWGLAPEADLAWVRRPSQGSHVVSLVSLVDGAEMASATLPVDAFAVGATRNHLVVGAGGDTFVVDEGGEVAELADGQPLTTTNTDAIVARCDGSLACRIVAVDAATGDGLPVPGISGTAWTVVGAPNHPDGRAVLAGYDGADLVDVLLVGRDGVQPLLPDTVRSDSLYGSAWTPDGSLLLVQETGRIFVVDPFGDGGPALLSSFDPQTSIYGILAVFED